MIKFNNRKEVTKEQFESMTEEGWEDHFKYGGFFYAEPEDVISINFPGRVFEKSDRFEDMISGFPECEPVDENWVMRSVLGAKEGETEVVCKKVYYCQ
jgi:hypothetical protein